MKTEGNLDDLRIDTLLAECKEQPPQETQEEAGQSRTRLEVDIPKSLYKQSAQASAQIGISFDQYVADALEIYLGDEYAET
jgi:predicted HicB family RNase H-like nuclease